MKILLKILKEAKAIVATVNFVFLKRSNKETVTNILYKPKLEISERGYEIEVSEESTSGAGAEKVEQPNIEELMAVANAEAAKKLIKKCITCHSFEKGGANKIGPNLWAIAGAGKGKNPGFTYSKAMINAGGIWDDASLFAFLHKPSKYLPGTKMSFVGIRNPQDVANVIAYLKANSQ